MKVLSALALALTMSLSHCSGMTPALAGTHSKDVLKGAAAIVNRAGDEHAGADTVLERLQAYMAEKGVTLPATFTDQNSTIVLKALKQVFHKEGGSSVIAIASIDGTDQVFTVYRATSRRAGK